LYSYKIVLIKINTRLILIFQGHRSERYSFQRLAYCKFEAMAIVAVLATWRKIQFGV